MHSTKSLIRVNGFLLVLLFSATANRILYDTRWGPDSSRPFEETGQLFYCDEENQLSRANLNLLKSIDIKRLVINGDMVYLFLSGNKTLNFRAPLLEKGCKGGARCLIRGPSFFRLHNFHRSPQLSQIGAQQPFGHYTQNFLNRAIRAQSTFELSSGTGCRDNATVCAHQLDFSFNNFFEPRRPGDRTYYMLPKLLRQLNGGNFTEAPAILLMQEDSVFEEIAGEPNVPIEIYEANYSSTDLVLSKHWLRRDDYFAYTLRTQSYRLQAPVKFAALYHQVNTEASDDMLYLYEIDQHSRLGVRQFELDNFKMLAHFTMSLESFFSCPRPIADPSECKTSISRESNNLIKLIN